MARNHYGRSDETYDVLRNHVQPIAAEYGCDDSYIYDIKNQRTPDPYPKFRHLFRSAAQAGAPVKIWLDDLQGIAIKKRSARPSLQKLAEDLLEKIQLNSDATAAIVSALGDKQLERHECHTVLAALALEAENIRNLEAMVQLQLSTA
jgi:hypothetical protein